MKKEVQNKLVTPKKTVVFLILLATFLFGTANLASAQFAPPRSFTLMPPAIAVTLAPGTKTEGTISILNDSFENVPFTTSIKDFIVDNNQGIPNFFAPNVTTNKYAASDWIAVTPTTFTAGSHDKATLHYYIQAPKNAAPGGHYAAALYTTGGVKAVQGSGSGVNAELGTIFYITVPGDIHYSANVKSFTVPNFQEYGPVTTTTEIANNSDVHIAPTGTVTIYNMLGGKVVTQPLPTHNIFPGASRVFQNTIGKHFMIGRYKAQLVASYGENNNLPLIATAYFWVFPWKVMTIVALIIIALILAFIVYKRRKNPPTGGHTEQPEAPSSPAPVTTEPEVTA